MGTSAMLPFPWPVDDDGPRMVAVLRLPEGCTGMVVIDSTTLGAAIGGLRVRSEVTAAELTRVARVTTLRNAAAGLPHGGAAGGIRTPDRLERSTLERVVRAFAQAIRALDEYTPAPDLGTDETVMAWIHDEIGRGVGLPAVLGGIPLDEVGATGYGLMMCAAALDDAGQLQLPDARVAIQGFGAVGTHAAPAACCAYPTSSPTPAARSARRPSSAAAHRSRRLPTCHNACTATPPS
jgi:glutamate dehydrogenase (NAD(P)+)